jgi:hypothetical protein
MKLALISFAIYQHLLFLALIVSTVPHHKGSTTGLALSFDSEDASGTEHRESTSTTSEEIEAPKRGLWRTVFEFLLPDAQARLDEYEARMYRRIGESRPDPTLPSEGRERERNETEG